MVGRLKRVCFWLSLGWGHSGLVLDVGERNTAIRHRVPCEYCFSEQYCPVGSMECIKGITVEEVLAAVETYLQKSSERVGG